MLKEKVRSYLQKQIDQEFIPGAAIHISLDGKTLMHEVLGFRSLSPSKAPMEPNTIFDLASLTKVVATTTAILKLLDEGEIILGDPVTKFIPEFARNGKEDIRIFHLLTHTSGLTSHRRFYEESLSVDQVIEKICDEHLEYPTGEKVIYSDLGFILLARIIERVTGQEFSEFVQKILLTPLNMNETGFNLPLSKERFAATEPSQFLKEMKFGIVHDDNAESMGGISGHAGLFSTLDDLRKFSAMIESGGIYNGKKILSSRVLSVSRRNYTSFDSTEYRGLGWQLKGPKFSPCGDLFSSESYGHTGYTGTSIWFDPEINLHVILLTNRVHVKDQHEFLTIRPKIHNLIRANL